MLLKTKDIKTKIVNDKLYYQDDVIDKRFVMEYLDCSVQLALKYIRQTNIWAKKNTNKDPDYLPRGVTVLSWFFKTIGVKSEFI